MHTLIVNPEGNQLFTEVRFWKTYFSIRFLLPPSPIALHHYCQSIWEEWMTFLVINRLDHDSSQFRFEFTRAIKPYDLIILMSSSQILGWILSGRIWRLWLAAKCKVVLLMYILNNSFVHSFIQSIIVLAYLNPEWIQRVLMVIIWKSIFKLSIDCSADPDILPPMSLATANHHIASIVSFLIDRSMFLKSSYDRKLMFRF